MDVGAKMAKTEQEFLRKLREFGDEIQRWVVDEVGDEPSDDGDEPILVWLVMLYEVVEHAQKTISARVVAMN